MARVLATFPNVRPLQVTDGPLKHWEGLPPSDVATKETIAEYLGNDGVPALIIFHVASKRLVRMVGTQSEEQVLAAAATVLNGNAPNGTKGKDNDKTK